MTEYISSSKYYQFVQNFTKNLKIKFKAKFSYVTISKRDCAKLEDMPGFKDFCGNNKPIIQLFHSGSAADIVEFINKYNEYSELEIKLFKSPYGKDLIFFLVPRDMEFNEKNRIFWGKNLRK
jgi:hypothetical protein